MKKIICSFVALTLCSVLCYGNIHLQDTSAIKIKTKKHHSKTKTKTWKPASKKIVKYGIASFYAKKFNGRETANGEIYNSTHLTAACNVLPLNTWIKVTNLRNDKSVIVKINDRLHPKNKRLVDLSRAAAQKLGYVSRGLTRVKVEVLDNFQVEM